MADTRWGLAADLHEALANHVPGPSKLGFDFARGASKPDVWVSTAPNDDRSPWHGSAESSPQREEGFVLVDESKIRSPQHSLTFILTILVECSDQSRGWRWRLAARVSELSYSRVLQETREGDEAATRLLPLHTWVRFRLLSEPFRVQPEARSNRRSTHTFEDSNDPEFGGSPWIFARSAFGGQHSLQRRARESRDVWAQTLLQMQDTPTLATIDPDKEGRLLAFVDTRHRNILSLSGRRDTGEQTESVFLAWFSREFFSRRFMLADMWKTSNSPWKRATMFLAICAVLSGLLAVLTWIPLYLFFSILVACLGSLVGGIVWSKDGEMHSYPFLVRFGAGTALGSAAVVTMRAGWLDNISNPGQGHEWRPWLVVAGLFIAGWVYLIVEARFHGTKPAASLRRASVVWLVGLSWAVVIATVDVVAIAPIFTEDYLEFSNESSRLWAFAITALASLDFGIFLQVLWEDRPVTYPLGAMRLSNKG